MKQNLILSLLVILVIVSTLDAVKYPAPPSLKGNLKSVEELEAYLKQLQTYLTVVGRPRFGY